MKERPILFSAPMVRALLAGTKTQTRRAWRVQPPPGVPVGYVPGQTKVPYGHQGDRLWVREAWMPDPPCDGTWGYTAWAGCREGQIAGVPDRFRSPKHCIYAAEWSGIPARWTPSIHMPRWASRITLEVTDVRMERLQDISEADALAEGVETWRAGWDEKSAATAFLHGTQARIKTNQGAIAQRLYYLLWESINGPGSWDANPWVWVVEFRRVQP